MFKLIKKEKIENDIVLTYSYDFEENNEKMANNFANWMTKRNIWNTTSIDKPKDNPNLINAELAGKGKKIKLSMHLDDKKLTIITNYKRENDTIEEFMNEIFDEYLEFIEKHAVKDYLLKDRSKFTIKYAYKLLDEFFKIDNIDQMDKFYDKNFRWMENKVYMKKDINYIKTIYQSVKADLKINDKPKDETTREVKEAEDTKMDNEINDIKINGQVEDSTSYDNLDDEPSIVNEIKKPTKISSNNNVDKHIYKDLSKPINKPKKEKNIEKDMHFRDLSKPMHKPPKQVEKTTGKKQTKNYEFELIYATGSKTFNKQNYDGMVINDEGLTIIHDGEETEVTIDTSKIKSYIIECIPVLLEMEEKAKNENLIPVHSSSRSNIEVKYEKNDIYLNGNIIENPYHEAYTSFETEIKNILNYF